MGFTETSKFSVRTLPDFEAPPVVETALALRFAPISGWNLLHFGKLVTRFEKFYPKIQLRPAIGAEVQFRLDAENLQIPIRCWFLTDDESQVVQVQDNLFGRNWRKTQQVSEYRHYEEIRPLFERDWDTFLRFVQEHDLPAPNIWQCEVTYINHLLRGREWRDFEDLAGIFPIWNGISAEGLFEKVDVAGFHVSFRLPDGNLSFAIQPAVRKSDGAEVIQLTVTAMGKPPTSNKSDVLLCFDNSRASVVNGFTQFTTAKVHNIWGIKI